MSNKYDPILGEYRQNDASGLMLYANVTYYVDTTGSDVTGDGSAGFPFATANHALSLIPKNLNGFIASVVLNAGSYTDYIYADYFFGGELHIGGGGSYGTTITYSGEIIYLYNVSALTQVYNFNLVETGDWYPCVYVNNCS